MRPILIENGYQLAEYLGLKAAPQFALEEALLTTPPAGTGSDPFRRNEKVDTTRDGGWALVIMADKRGEISGDESDLAELGTTKLPPNEIFYVKGWRVRPDGPPMLVAVPEKKNVKEMLRDMGDDPTADLDRFAVVASPSTFVRHEARGEYDGEQIRRKQGVFHKGALKSWEKREAEEGEELFREWAIQWHMGMEWREKMWSLYVQQNEFFRILDFFDYVEEHAEDFFPPDSFVFTPEGRELLPKQSSGPGRDLAAPSPVKASTPDFADEDLEAVERIFMQAGFTSIEVPLSGLLPVEKFRVAIGPGSKGGSGVPAHPVYDIYGEPTDVGYAGSPESYAAGLGPDPDSPEGQAEARRIAAFTDDVRQARADISKLLAHKGEGGAQIGHIDRLAQAREFKGTELERAEARLAQAIAAVADARIPRGFSTPFTGVSSEENAPLKYIAAEAAARGYKLDIGSKQRGADAPPARLFRLKVGDGRFLSIMAAVDPDTEKDSKVFAIVWVNPRHITRAGEWKRPHKQYVAIVPPEDPPTMKMSLGTREGQQQLELYLHFAPQNLEWASIVFGAFAHMKTFKNAVFKRGIQYALRDFRYSQGTAAGEEVYNGVLTKMWEKIASGKYDISRSALPTWAVSIAKNEAKNVLREQERHQVYDPQEVVHYQVGTGHKGRPVFRQGVVDQEESMNNGKLPCFEEMVERVHGVCEDRGNRPFFKGAPGAEPSTPPRRIPELPPKEGPESRDKEEPDEDSWMAGPLGVPLRVFLRGLRGAKREKEAARYHQALGQIQGVTPIAKGEISRRIRKLEIFLDDLYNLYMGGTGQGGFQGLIRKAFKKLSNYLNVNAEDQLFNPPPVLRGKGGQSFTPPASIWKREFVQSVGRAKSEAYKLINDFLVKDLLGLEIRGQLTKLLQLIQDRINDAEELLVFPLGTGHREARRAEGGAARALQQYQLVFDVVERIIEDPELGQGTQEEWDKYSDLVSQALRGVQGMLGGIEGALYGLEEVIRRARAANRMVKGGTAERFSKEGADEQEHVVLMALADMDGRADIDELIDATRLSRKEVQAAAKSLIAKGVVIDTGTGISGTMVLALAGSPIETGWKTPEQARRAAVRRKHRRTKNAPPSAVLSPGEIPSDLYPREREDWRTESMQDGVNKLLSEGYSFEDALNEVWTPWDIGGQVKRGVLRAHELGGPMGVLGAPLYGLGRLIGGEYAREQEARLKGLAARLKTVRKVEIKEFRKLFDKYRKAMGKALAPIVQWSEHVDDPAPEAGTTGGWKLEFNFNRGRTVPPLELRTGGEEQGEIPDPSWWVRPPGRESDSKEAKRAREEYAKRKKAGKIPPLKDILRNVIAPVIQGGQDLGMVPKLRKAKSTLGEMRRFLSSMGDALPEITSLRGKLNAVIDAWPSLDRAYLLAEEAADYGPEDFFRAVDRLLRIVGQIVWNVRAMTKDLSFIYAAVGQTLIAAELEGYERVSILPGEGDLLGKEAERKLRSREWGGKVGEYRGRKMRALPLLPQGQGEE